MINRKRLSHYEQPFLFFDQLFKALRRRALPELRSGRDPVSCSAKGTLSPLTPCQGLARPWMGAMLPALCGAVLVM